KRVLDGRSQLARLRLEASERLARAAPHVRRRVREQRAERSARIGVRMLAERELRLVDDAPIAVGQGLAQLALAVRLGGDVAQALRGEDALARVLRGQAGLECFARALGLAPLQGEQRAPHDLCLGLDALGRGRAAERRWGARLCD